MPSDNLTAWLGPAAEQLTPDQIDRLGDEAARIDERYPDPDEQPVRDAALSVAVQHLLGETSTDEVAQTLADARLAVERAFAAAVQLGVMLVADGEPKATAARSVGIDRMSLLKALGER